MSSSTPDDDLWGQGLSRVPGTRSCCAEGQRGNEGRDGDGWVALLPGGATTEGWVSEDGGATSALHKEHCVLGCAKKGK